MSLKIALVPVQIGGGLVVLHTPEEYAALLRDVDMVAARLMRAWPLEQAVAAHLAHFYGSRADGVVALAAERPELLERLHADAPDIGAQVVFAAREEWATSSADVLHRRTTLAARGLTGADVRACVDALLGSALPR